MGKLFSLLVLLGLGYAGLYFYYGVVIEKEVEQQLEARGLSSVIVTIPAVSSLAMAFWCLGNPPANLLGLDAVYLPQTEEATAGEQWHGSSGTVERGLLLDR